MSKYAPHRSSASNPRATADTLCQRCLQRGHYIYQCKFERPYVSRPSRTQMMENPKLRKKLADLSAPSVEVPDEFKKKGIATKILEEKEKKRSAEECSSKEVAQSKNKKAKRSRSRSNSKSGSDSDSGSDSGTESGSESRSSNSRSESPSRSRERNEKRRVPRKQSRSRSQTRSRSRSRAKSDDSEEDGVDGSRGRR